MEYFALLQELNECHAPSGNEGVLAKRLAELARPYADECYTDTLGNLIVHKREAGLSSYLLPIWIPSVLW